MCGRCICGGSQCRGFLDLSYNFMGFSLQYFQGCIFGNLKLVLQRDVGTFVIIVLLFVRVKRGVCCLVLVDEQSVVLYRMEFYGELYRRMEFCYLQENGQGLL